MIDRINKDRKQAFGLFFAKKRKPSKSESFPVALFR